MGRIENKDGDLVSTNTTNYNLVKPSDNETADISVINGNMDTIDTALANASQITDTITGLKYKFGVENGLAFIEQVG